MEFGKLGVTSTSLYYDIRQFTSYWNIILDVKQNFRSVPGYCSMVIYVTWGKTTDSNTHFKESFGFSEVTLSEPVTVVSTI